MGDFLAVSCGGGRNNAMVFGFYERGIMPDILMFADTGGEKPETYEAIERLSKWCDTHLGQSIIVLNKNSMYSSLEDQCLRTHTLPSAAYGWRSCSDKWKIQPQEKYLNNLPAAQRFWNSCVHCGFQDFEHPNAAPPDNAGWCPVIPCITQFKKGRKITKALGYDAGESRRGEKIKEDDKYRFWFPLKEWGWYLEDCIEAFKRHGLPVPPKSACFYCPSSTKLEVKALAKEHPDLFARAVEIERNAENLQVVKGLGRHWSWEELVQISEQQAELFPEAPRMTCTCNDGTSDED